MRFHFQHRVQINAAFFYVVALNRKAYTMSEDLQNEITNDYNIKVYLGSLDGSRGEWVTLPLPEEELDKVYERCESSGGEAFILDSYQTPLTEAANYKIDQYDNIYDLNILAHVASCTDYDPDAIEALASYNSFKNPLEIANAVYQCDEIPFEHFTDYDPALSPEENFANIWRRLVPQSQKRLKDILIYKATEKILEMITF